MSTTPNMNLTLPTVSQTPGPTWANQINADLSVIDSHNHVPGAGAQIPSAALNINADVGFGTYSAVGLGSTQYVNQLATSAACAVYALGGDLYYNNASAVPVQITSGGSVVGPSGSWTNLALPAVAGYGVGTGTFYFQRDAINFGALQAGSVVLQSTTSTNRIDILSSLTTASYSLTLPTSAPTATGSILSSAFGGAMSWMNADASLSVTSSSIGIANGGVTQIKMEPKTCNPSSTISGSYGPGTYTLKTITPSIVSGRPVYIAVQPIWANTLTISSDSTSGSNFIYAWYSITSPTAQVYQGGAISVYGGSSLDMKPVLFQATETGVYQVQFKIQVLSGANIVFSNLELVAFQL